MFGALLGSLGSEAFPLLDVDEPRFATTSRNMLERGDFLVPWFNGEVRYDKPPLIYWLQAGSFLALGPSEFSARLPSALALGIASALTALLAFRRTGRSTTAWLAGAVLATCVQAQIMAHACTADSVLLACVVVTITGAVLREEGQRNAATWLMWYAGAGLCLLAKGPPGIVAPLCVALALRRFGMWTSWLPGLALALAIPLAWFLPADRATGGGFWDQGVLHHVVDRSLRPFEGHGGLQPWYYLAAVPGMFFPWSVFLPGAVAAAWRRRREAPVWDRIALCWAAGVLLVFTAVSSKLPHYVLPVYPLLAIETARRIEGLQGRHARIEAGTFLAAGLLVPAALIPAALLSGLGFALPAIVALCALAVCTGAGGFLLLRRGRALACAGFMALAMVLIMGVLTRGLLATLDGSHALSSGIQRRLGHRLGEQIMTLDLDLPTLVFYSGRELLRADRQGGDKHLRALEFLDRPGHGWLVVRERDIPRLVDAANAAGRSDLAARLAQPEARIHGFHPGRWRWFDVAIVKSGA